MMMLRSGCTVVMACRVRAVEVCAGISSKPKGRKASPQIPPLPNRAARRPVAANRTGATSAVEPERTIEMRLEERPTPFQRINSESKRRTGRRRSHKEYVLIQVDFGGLCANSRLPAHRG